MSSRSKLEEIDTILLIEKRYHTNQHPVVTSFLDAGHNIRFLALEKEQNEEYSALTPDMVKFSPVFIFIHMIVHRFLVEIDRYRVCIPSVVWYYRYLRSVDPDLVVVKKYTATSFATIIYTKLLGIELVFYDQAPVYDDNPFYIKRWFATLLYYFANGERFVRYTPVLGNPKERVAIPRSYYIPFVAPSGVTADQRSYFRDSCVNILMVGKLHSRRKNHIKLLKSIAGVADKYDIRITLIGSLRDQNDRYYAKIRSTIIDEGLEEIVVIKRNLSYEAVQAEYRRHDLYVLPSEREPAAVSHLEAMSNGLPIICSETNGTSHYIQEGENGFLIDPSDETNLTETIERLVSSREMIRSFGRTSCHLAQTHYSTDRFYDRFSWMIQENFL